MPDIIAANLPEMTNKLRGELQENQKQFVNTISQRIKTAGGALFIKGINSRRRYGDKGADRLDKLTVLKNDPLPGQTAGAAPQSGAAAENPQKAPWSVTASQEADQLARQSELDAAQAEIDAKNKLALFNKDGTAEEKVAAQEAEKEAKELELRAQMAEEVAAEQARWATEQGELLTANKILEQHPDLYDVDQNTTLPK